MNYNLTNLADFEISLILKFLFGSVIEIGEGKNIKALNFRLVCKKFKRVFDRLAYLSINTDSIDNYYNCPPSEISSIYMYSCGVSKITKQDWEDLFGDELSNLESELEYLRVRVNSVKYLPKFKYIESISWEVRAGCYDLLEGVPHDNLIIKGYKPYYGSISHFTKLSEIEIILRDSDNKLISEYLPSTILHMTIFIYTDKVDVLDLSKFRSLKCLEIVAEYGRELIEELILPPGVYEFYSDVKIKKMNLHECEKLEILELKYTSKCDITVPYLPNLYELRVDSFGGSYSIDTRTLTEIESLTVGVILRHHNTQWSVEFDELNNCIKTSCAISLIPLCRNLVELKIENNRWWPGRERISQYIKNSILILDINNEHLNYIKGVGFSCIVVVIKSHREIEYIDIDTDELNVIHEQKNN